MHERIYVCHTFYHVYVACLKEFHVLHQADLSGGKAGMGSGKVGRATLVLSKMSNNFGHLKERALACGLFEDVVEFDEKKDTFFPELASLKKDTGSLVRNMWNRIRFCRLFPKLQEPFVPVDFRAYKDRYVFCDSDPIGYYLNGNQIPYHALEDGLNCIKNYDTARYDNRGHFKFKAWMAARGFIFIQNGWARYCQDMEVNDISVLTYPCPKYIEQPREDLVQELTRTDKDLLLKLFIENLEELKERLAKGKDQPRVLILSEPLCDLTTRERIFKDIIASYHQVDGQEAVVMIKQHPRDLLDYKEKFPEAVLLDGTFPMELLNFLPGLRFDLVVSVYTMVDALHFVDRKVFLGHDFMDRYEDPKAHRWNEQIVP